MLPVADGSDLMGSLRNPAAFNGIIGMRPSIGRVPTLPTPELFFQQLGTLGPMARTVLDVGRLLATQSGYQVGAPLSLDGDGGAFSQDLNSNPGGQRVGWLGDLGGYLPFEAGILDLCRGTLQRAAALGCHVEYAAVDFDMGRLWRAWLVLRQWLVSNRLKDLYRDHQKRAHIKPEAIWEIEHGLKLTASDVFDASIVRSDWYRAMGRMFERYDVLALPAAQVFPFDIDVAMANPDRRQAHGDLSSVDGGGDRAEHHRLARNRHAGRLQSAGPAGRTSVDRTAAVGSLVAEVCLCVRARDC
jgi:amidase